MLPFEVVLLKEQASYSLPIAGHYVSEKQQLGWAIPTLPYQVCFVFLFTSLDIEPFFHILLVSPLISHRRYFGRFEILVANSLF